MNRRPQVEDAMIDSIYTLIIFNTPMEAANSELSKQVLRKLLSAKGMRLPMTSTVLHFYYPDVYPIIDQRAYRELYGEEFPKYTNKTDNIIELYMGYMKDCFIYQQSNCPQIPFNKIDKVLYQLDKEKGFKVRY